MNQHELPRALRMERGATAIVYQMRSDADWGLGDHVLPALKLVARISDQLLDHFDRFDLLQCHQMIAVSPGPSLETHSLLLLLLLLRSLVYRGIPSDRHCDTREPAQVSVGREVLDVPRGDLDGGWRLALGLGGLGGLGLGRWSSSTTCTRR